MSGFVLSIFAGFSVVLCWRIYELLTRLNQKKWPNATGVNAVTFNQFHVAAICIVYEWMSLLDLIPLSADWMDSMNIHIDNERIQMITVAWHNSAMVIEIHSSGFI